MSTIASPRDHASTPSRRVPSATNTPTSSTRPSLDAARAAPVPSPPVHNGVPAAKRANRAALREYYNLRAAAAAAAGGLAPRIGVELPDSEVPVGEVDVPGFCVSEYVARVVAESSLEDLLRLYTRVVGEVRALDAEKKALVYDNYSKLIAATETIHKMRSNMDPLNPMASTLNPAIAQIYSQAAEIREALRASIPAPDSDEGRRSSAAQRRQRTRDLAVRVLATPPRLRLLVADGRRAEAKTQWERARRLLQTWQDQGLGGDDEVRACIEEGDAAVAAPSSDSRASNDGRDSTS